MRVGSNPQKGTESTYAVPAARGGDRAAEVAGEAGRRDPDAKALADEERSEKPEHVEASGRVVTEIARLVDAAGAELREPLSPRLECTHVGREPLRAHREQADDHADRDRCRHDELSAALAASLIAVHCQYSKRVIAIVA